MAAKKGSGEGKNVKDDVNTATLKSTDVATDQPTKMGRPTTYTPELAAEICQQLAIGYSIRTVCKPDHMPAVSTFFLWLRDHKDFSEQYTRAKQEAADAMAEDILDIADDASNDWMELNADEEGQERYSLNGEHVQRSRLRIETRKFLMSKMKPKKYGDKLDLTSDGKALPTPIFGGMSVKSDDEGKED